MDADVFWDLALHFPLGRRGSHNLQDQSNSFGAVRGVMNGNTVRLRLRAKLRKVRLKMRDDFRAYGVGALAALLPVRQRGKCPDLAVHPARSIRIQRSLERLVRDLLADLFAEESHSTVPASGN
jgi:hypothetical protein